ncbi:MAG TPA: cupin domain-containing protein [Bdellovibrionota bacterium]|jgi:quercetin dioxygenase-like cupin family protein|nr:cupin domain-containing protein [Bdellovibrionota bacterium]
MSAETFRVVSWDRPHAPTEEEVEARLSQEGYHAFRWHDVPGASYPNHRHSRDECIWVLKGEIVFEINEQEIHLKSGDRLYLPSMKSHSAWVPESDGVTYVVGQKDAKQN